MRHRVRIQPYLSPEVHQKLRDYASSHRPLRGGGLKASAAAETRRSRFSRRAATRDRFARVTGMEQPFARRPHAGMHLSTVGLDEIGQAPRLVGNDGFADRENRGMAIEFGSALLPASAGGLGEDHR